MIFFSFDMLNSQNKTVLSNLKLKEKKSKQNFYLVITPILYSFSNLRVNVKEVTTLFVRKTFILTCMNSLLATFPLEKSNIKS